jgi:hypothetical protein
MMLTAFLQQRPRGRAPDAVSASGPALQRRPAPSWTGVTLSLGAALLNLRGINFCMRVEKAGNSGVSRRVLDIGKDSAFVDIQKIKLAMQLAVDDASHASVAPNVSL